jgi:hypothetical protein
VLGVNRRQAVPGCECDDPLAVLRNKLRKLDDPTPDAIEACLRQFYVASVITYEQNQKLNSGKRRSSMPDDWDEVDPYARYREVGIRNVGRVSV